MSGRTFKASKNKLYMKLTKDAVDYTNIKGLEGIKVEIDNGIEKFYLMDMEGWAEVEGTTKALTFAFTAKTLNGDPGNEAILGLADLMEKRDFKWTLANGTTWTFEGLVAINSIGGETAEVDTFEFEIHLNGKPTITPVAVG